MDICSGRFATQEATQQQHAAQELDLNDDDFVSQVPENEVKDVAASPVKNNRKLLESTDDEAEVIPENNKQKRRKKRKQKLKKLNFSDEEEATSDQLDEEDEMLEEAETLDEECEEEEEQEEVLVDYDSEENEIEVKMKKNDRIKAAGAYFENEAELSESDWGSADEDEKDLNKYDIELGDEEQFDQNQLREEVGRIHARKVLDDDMKKIKKIEEMLFEDEENDGVGRERKFRWKNQNDDFTANDNARDDDTVDCDDGEEESEIAWRKMRFEREQVLREESLKTSASETTSQSFIHFDQSSQTVSTVGFQRKFRIEKPGSMIKILPASDLSSNSTFLIKATDMSKYKRSSFLARGEETLSKVARYMSSHRDDEVTNMSSHGGNSMSFATIEKPDDSKKRKSDASNQQEASKKRKVENQKKSFLLDQL